MKNLNANINKTFCELFIDEVCDATAPPAG